MKTGESKMVNDREYLEKLRKHFKDNPHCIKNAKIECIRGDNIFLQKEISELCDRLEKSLDKKDQK